VGVCGLGSCSLWVSANWAVVFVGVCGLGICSFWVSADWTFVVCWLSADWAFVVFGCLRTGQL